MSMTFCPNCRGLVDDEGYYDDNFLDLIFCCEECASIYRDENLYNYDDLDYNDPRDFDENGDYLGDEDELEE